MIFNSHRENVIEEIIIKTPILDEAVIQHAKSVELNGDSNGSIQSYYPKSLQDLIVELDNLRSPLQKTYQKVIDIKQESQRAILSSSNLLTTAQESIGKAAIGLAAVKVLHEEVNLITYIVYYSIFLHISFIHMYYALILTILINNHSVNKFEKNI